MTYARCRTFGGELPFREAATEQAIQTLMGKEVAPRFEFIMERAPKVDEGDV